VKDVVEPFIRGEYNETIKILKKIPGNQKGETLLLVEARCHEVMGNYKGALSASGQLIQKMANYEKWEQGSPRMLAVTLGANAAMQLGMSDKAKKFYQTVLKFDPDQKQARKQYQGLKKVIKHLSNADDQITKVRQGEERRTAGSNRQQQHQTALLCAPPLYSIAQ